MEEPAKPQEELAQLEEEGTTLDYNKIVQAAEVTSPSADVANVESRLLASLREESGGTGGTSQTKAAEDAVAVIAKASVDGRLAERLSEENEGYGEATQVQRTHNVVGAIAQASMDGSLSENLFRDCGVLGEAAEAKGIVNAVDSSAEASVDGSLIGQPGAENVFAALEEASVDGSSIGRFAAGSGRNGEVAQTDRIENSVSASASASVDDNLFGQLGAGSGGHVDAIQNEGVENVFGAFVEVSVDDNSTRQLIGGTGDREESRNVLIPEPQDETLDANSDGEWDVNMFEQELHSSEKQEDADWSMRTFDSLMNSFKDLDPTLLGIKTKKHQWGERPYCKIYPAHEELKREASATWNNLDSTRSKKPPAAEHVAAAAAHKDACEKQNAAIRAKYKERDKADSQRQKSELRRSISSPQFPPLGRNLPPALQPTNSEQFGMLENDSRTLALGKHGERTPQMTHDPFGNIGGVHGPMLSYMTWAHQEQNVGKLASGQPVPPGFSTAPVPLPPPMTIAQARAQRSSGAASSTSLPAAPTASGSHSTSSGQPRFRYAGGNGRPRQDPGKVYNQDGSFKLKGVASLSDVHKYTKGVQAHSRKHWEVREAYKLMRAEQHASAASSTWAALHQWTASERSFDKWYGNAAKKRAPQSATASSPSRIEGIHPR